MSPSGFLTTTKFFPGKHSYRKLCAVKIAQRKLNTLFAVFVVGNKQLTKPNYILQCIHTSIM